MAYRVKVIAESFLKNKQLCEELISHFPDAVFYSGNPNDTVSIQNFSRDAECLLVGREKIDIPFLENCPDLKFISKYGVGTDNLDMDAMNKSGIELGWTAGVNSFSVAELTLGFMLGAAHNMFRTNHLMKHGHWYKNGGFMLQGKTVGIIGLGNIGKDLVKLLQPFNCRILANDIEDISEYCTRNNLSSVSKDVIYRESDFITVHIPLNHSTHHLISTQAFLLIKPGAILINAARGGIVDESALKIALKENRLAAACLDVFEEEPCTDTDLTGHDHVTVTPHIGGNTNEAVLAMGRSAILHIRNFYST